MNIFKEYNTNYYTTTIMTEVKKNSVDALVRLKKKDLRTVNSMNRSVYYPFNPNKLSESPLLLFGSLCTIGTNQLSVLHRALYIHLYNICIQVGIYLSNIANEHALQILGNYRIPRSSTDNSKVFVFFFSWSNF